MRATLVALLLLVSACGGASDDELRVVATTNIVGDVVSSIVNGDAAVEVLVPIGIDPHDFRASARQVASLTEADLVVANGLGLEEGLADVLDAAADDGVSILEIAPLLDPIPFGPETESRGEDEGEERGSGDPHVWLDPVRMGEAARLIALRLAEIDPAVDWVARAESYGGELAVAHELVTDTLSPVTDRTLVTNHDALGYFADRYGFEVVGVVIPGGSTLSDPSSRELAELVEIMEDDGVSVIFAETTQPSALAEAVAAELGEDVVVVSLYTGSLGEAGSGAETLIGMLRTNAERIAGALS